MGYFSRGRPFKMHPLQKKFFSLFWESGGRKALEITSNLARARRRLRLRNLLKSWSKRGRFFANSFFTWRHQIHLSSTSRIAYRYTVCRNVPSCPGNIAASNRHGCGRKWKCYHFAFCAFAKKSTSVSPRWYEREEMKICSFRYFWRAENWRGGGENVKLKHENLLGE